MSTLVVEGKVIGQKKPLFTDWVIPLPPKDHGERMRLRDLITRVAREEVDAYNKRQEQKRFTRILSRSEIDQAAARGKVDMGGQDSGVTADANEAVNTALTAFSDGLYFVFVDDEQQSDLDAELFLKTDSKVTFIRLTPLAGG
jgi:hypothetical protein